ncbi:MAG: FadR/GntR family transcriptional regulator [Solirubrobacteraceae bacterium]
MWSAEQTDLRAPQLYERIAARLAEDVRSGALAPGERLPGERELARRLGVGRSSVREAIAALQVDGIVVTRPGSGTYVADDGVRRAADREPGGAAPADASPSALLEARALLEPQVAALAARRAGRDAEAERLLEAMEAVDDAGSPTGRLAWNDADRLFHRRLAVMTGNPVLAALADHVAAVMDQPLWQRLRDDSVAVAGRMRLHVAEHRMIYEAVVSGDAAAAEFYAAQHIDRVRRYMTLD